MWVDVKVDALVKYTKGLQSLSRRAIRWNDRRIDLKGSAQVARGTISLSDLCTDGLMRCSIPFEPTRQTWYLEAIGGSASEPLARKEGGPGPGGPGPRFAEGVVCSWSTPRPPACSGTESPQPCLLFRVFS
jgi:hypothetical protein